MSRPSSTGCASTTRACLSSSGRAGFYGLDIYNMSGSIAAVLEYLDKVDPEAAAVARERYGCLTPWQKEPCDLRPGGAHGRLRANASRR